MKVPRKETIGSCDLWLGDCREILPMLLGDVDAVITDPVWPNCPPGLLIGSENPLQLWRETWAVMPAVQRAVVVLRHDCDPRFLSPVPLAYSRAVMLPYVMPGYIGRFLGGDEIAYCFGEPIPSRDGQRVIPGRAPSVQPGGRKANGHPCSRSEQHFVFLVRWWSEPGEAIIDPFMGSGTTGVCCAKMGRRFIGMEIEERYHSIACRRIDEAYRQMDLFLEGPPSLPEQISLMRVE